LGPPALYVTATPSPDARYLLVEALHRPFSYLVPASRFPRKTEIWQASGQLVRQLADLPLADEVPIEFSSTRVGPRSFEWRADVPATRTWVEARAGGEARVRADIRARLLALTGPFQGEPVPLISLSLRFAGLVWGDERTALVTETWYKTRKSRTWRMRPDAPE